MHLKGRSLRGDCDIHNITKLLDSDIIATLQITPNTFYDHDLFVRKQPKNADKIKMAILEKLRGLSFCNVKYMFQ